eukprot:TRINITY_DN4418_c0_g1_i9.p1 TRINITY_DN4418_c0_g1~~TRINITY_DN4418_c0_g1_i9.p1  ORF type:complete len:291 (-),score=57.84 TRINITY_DN4418_c0_g1_i9:362-1234(-)
MSYLAMSNISLILKDSASSAVYRSKADAVTERINRLFLNTSTGTYAVGGRGDGGSSQCGQGMSIFEGIVPAAQKTQAVAALRDGVTAATNLTNTAGQGPVQGGSGPHITAGMFGIKWALMALSDNGLNDLAFEAVSSPSFPSLGWMMKNQFANATTTWESYFYSNNTFSHNHPMFGSYTVWLMQSVGGIQPHPAANGMDRVLIKPRPPQALNSATVQFESARGLIMVSWNQNSPAGAQLNVTIPPNVRADLLVPGADPGCLHAVGTVGSGNFSFKGTRFCTTSSTPEPIV